MRLLLVAVFAVVGLAGCAENPTLAASGVYTLSTTPNQRDVSIKNHVLLGEVEIVGVGQLGVPKVAGDTNSPYNTFPVSPGWFVRSSYAPADPHASPPVLDTPR